MKQHDISRTDKPRRYNFDVIRYSTMWGLLSLSLVVISLILFFTKGFVFGVDFAGGTEVQVKFSQPVEADRIRTLVEGAGFREPFIQAIGETNDEFLVRVESAKGESEAKINEGNSANIEKITGALKSGLPLAENGVLRVDVVGPQVGADLKRDSILAMFYSLLVIMIYVGLRFDYRYAPGAVICLFHDAIVTLGIFSLFGYEVNIQIMAAILTLIGFSLNDTIINYDRIRENEVVMKGQDLGHIINRSVNDVFQRSMLTSVCVFVSCVSLYFIAEGVIKDIAFTLGIGVVIGAYSSVFISNPFVMWMDRIGKVKARPIA